MKTYRVYQNLTQFAITIEAKSESEAIDKAEKREDWEEYEPVAENIFFDAVEVETEAGTLARKQAEEFEKLASHLDDEDVTALNKLLENERKLAVIEGE